LSSYYDINSLIFANLVYLILFLVLVLVVGHRGCRGLEPENTLMSFKKAIKLGVQAIELDIVVSGDYQIVVSHEPFMSQTYCLKPDGNELTSEEDQKYNLYQMSYQEIKQFDCGLKVHPRFVNQKKQTAYKPLLSEVIESCEVFTKNNSFSSITYIIEIKSNSTYYDVFYPKPKEYVALVLRTIAQYDFKDRIVLKSFDVAILNEIKKQQPEIKVSLLVNREEVIFDKLKQLNFTPEILGPYYQLLNKEIVVKYQNLRFLIYAWTVNEMPEIERIQSYGVDGIITDYPNRLVEVLV